MIYEMGVYKTKPGCRAQWVTFFEEQIILATDKAGMPFSGYFCSVEDEDTFVWIRGFEDEADRQAKRTNFYNSDIWLTSLKDKVAALMDDRTTVIIMEPGALSLFK